jgi:basic membrane lipoprotein Med (substrate-binding protein (PBP1-ABC) superfamily)
MYEAKFIIGAIAGALAENNRVGYICDYPIFGMIAGINAFAMGVQMVRPQAKVYLEWASIGGSAAAVERLTNQGIDLISSLDMARPGSDGPSNFGLAEVSSDGQINLAMPVWHWGVYYERIIRSILNRTFQTEGEESERALNYYWGMSAGVVEVLYSGRMPEGAKRLAELLRDAICNGNYHPFRGPVRNQSGEVVLNSHAQELSLEQIINMDWLAENVVGSIPEYEELSDEGKATVDMAGIKPVTQSKK